MPEMTVDEMRELRLSSLLLGRPGTSCAGIADWFGAMQSQDLASGKWSFGLRLPGSSEQDVDASIAAGEVLRTWPMRGTIHFIHPANARWLLDVTGVRALNGVQRRWQYLGLDEVTVTRAAELLGEALSGGRSMTRSQAVAFFTQNGIDASGQRAYHLLWYCAQTGVTCIGPTVGKEQTFVRLDDWAPEQRVLSRSQALTELARRYFQSHGPTTREDFQGWSGLTAADAKAGIAGADLDEATYGGKPVHYVAGQAAADVDEILLLPGFDEFLLGFKDRSVFLSQGHAGRITPGGNGVFRPTVVHHGRVIGTWRRTLTTRAVKVSVELFEQSRADIRRHIVHRAEEYADYVGLPAVVSYVGDHS